MKPDLAIFLPSLDGGGAEKVMLALAAEFGCNGVNCDLVIAASKGALMTEVPPSVRLVELNGAKPLWSVGRLASYLRSEKPKALLSTVFSANIAALLAAFAVAKRPKVFICEANPTEADIISPSRIDTWLNHMAAKVLYPSASGVIAISHGVEHSVRKYSRRAPLIRIPNPLPVDRQTLNRTAPMHFPRRTVIACGRLSMQKDYPTMLRSFALLREAIDVQLVILGDGELRHSLEALASELKIDEHVHFMGFQADPYPFMKGADVFLHTASYEGFGVVLLEAMALGCPIVATDAAGGVREVLDEGRCGTLVPVGDERQIANEVFGVLAHGGVRPDVSYLDQFDVKQVANRYLDLIFGDEKTKASRSS